ncbi:MAG TPA: ABC transporter permease [Gemmatimonadales bacterium]|nr:ABC transporter permease [Gemmatimonadales bacterium]
MTAVSTTPTRVTTPHADTDPAHALAEVWRFREFLRSLVVRNLKVKYQRSMLGFVWTLVNPLLTIGVLVVVFTHVVKIRVPDYWAFLLSGYFVWNYVIQMLGNATWVLAEHAPLRRSVAFPSEVLILGTAASRFAEFAIELGLALAALALFHHHGVPASWALLPVLLLVQVLLTLGLVLPLATLSAFYTDVQHALPVVLMLLFYASPVFYPAHLVPGTLHDLYFLNPLAGLLTLFHTVLFEGRWPSATLLGGMLAASVGLFLVGYALFNRSKAVFAELA